MQNILSKVSIIISESQKEYQTELDRNSDRAEYWRGKIDGLYAIKTLMMMQPDEPDIIDLSDAIEPGDGIIDKLDRMGDVMMITHNMMLVIA